MLMCTAAENPGGSVNRLSVAAFSWEVFTNSEHWTDSENQKQEKPEKCWRSIELK